MPGRFSVDAVFRAVDRVSAPVTRMQNRVGKFTRTASRGFHKLNRMVGKFSAGFKRGAVIVAASAAIIAGAAVSVLGAGADFEQAITNVGAVAMKTRAEIAPLEQLALQLGKTTKFTATQAANAMEILSRAGFNTQQVLVATPAILSAAAASGLEIAEVAGHVSNVLKGMGLEMDQAARISDVLALASSKTNSTIGSLGESMKNVAATARQLKIPLEDTVAAVALLQDVGLDASVAGSAFNTMLTKMAAPSAKITKQMRKFGVTFKDAKGNMLPFQKVIEQLAKASKKAGGNFDQVAFLAELVGLRGQKAASNLGMLFETGKLEKLTAELKNAEGAAGRMADIRMDTVQGSLLLLQSAVDGVKVKIFDLNRGPLKNMIDSLTAWVSANEDVIASDVGGWVTDALPAIKAMAGMMQSIAKFTFELGSGLGIVAAKIALIAEKIPGGIKSALTTNIGGFGADFDPDSPEANGAAPGVVSPEANGAAPGVVSPQERVAKSIDEQRTTSTAEVTVKAAQGTEAEVTGGKLGPGLQLQQSGAF